MHEHEHEQLMFSYGNMTDAIDYTKRGNILQLIITCTTAVT